MPSKNSRNIIFFFISVSVISATLRCVIGSVDKAGQILEGPKCPAKELGLYSISSQALIDF